MTFEEILSELRIPKAPEGHHHSRVGWIQIDCPFCGRESRKWHLGYSVEDKFLNCWQCGYHTLTSVLKELTNLSYHEIKRLVGSVEKERIRKLRPAGKLKLPTGVGEPQPAHRKYLKQRGFNPFQIEKIWRIAGIGLAAELSWRIYIPIYYKGQTVSWTTRSISDKTTRYISAKPEQESFPHKQLLYGEDYARHGIIIHEGPIDVWATGPGAVATFGLNYSQAQVVRMAQYPIRAICFDSNREAQKVAGKLCDELSVFPGETYNVELDAEDAASAPPGEIVKLRRRFL